MPHQRPIGLPIDPAMQRVLEAVRQQQGLETLDQAAEFLARRRIRNGARKVSGPRALYPVR